MTKIFEDMPITIDTDVPGKTALIVTFDCLCNLRCFGCHYFVSRENAKKIEEKVAINKIISYLKSGVAECIVLTGGEVTISSNMMFLCKIINEIKQKTPNIEIIINTNGQFPINIYTLLYWNKNWNKNLTFHVDIKASEKEFEVNDLILGRPGYYKFYIRNLLNTLNLIYNTNNPNHVLRTVNYPIDKIYQKDANLNPSYIECIQQFVKSLNSKYNKNLSWFLNDFYDIN